MEALINKNTAFLPIFLPLMEISERVNLFWTVIS
jgi:hypothetical protein